MAENAGKKEKIEREDDYTARRVHLAGLSEKELEERFWNLCNQLTRPLVELSKNHTSPSIERSVLLRMGFSSLEAKAIVDRCVDYHLLGKGAGQVVLKTAWNEGLDVLTAGKKLAAGELWDICTNLFNISTPAALELSNGKKEG